MAAAAEAPPIWQPHPGPQTRFLQTTANEVLYGGAAGGGKSDGIIAMPLRWVHHPHFASLVLRRDSTQLTKLLARASEIYPRLGAKPRADGASVTWRFRSGASVRFTHMQHETDVARFDGDEFQLLEFDELTHFTEKQYRGVRARIRSPHPGLPRYTRSSSNPGGTGHEWVFRRFGAWLNPEFKCNGVLVPRLGPDGKLLPPALPGQALWYLMVGDVEQWVEKGTPGALSRVFIPARLTDNPSLTENDPLYQQQLDDLDPVRRRQLRDGDWLVKPAAGLLFNRSWFEIVERPPEDKEVIARVRFWDRAATVPSPEYPDPDWTVGLKMSRTKSDDYFIEDVARARLRPSGVNDLQRACAKLDGFRCAIGIFQDPGSAGVSELEQVEKNLLGYIQRVVKPTGDKLTRALPLSAVAEKKRIKLVRGPWIEPFLQELEAFPSKGVHDDQVDAASSAYLEVSESSGLARLRMLAQV